MPKGVFLNNTKYLSSKEAGNYAGYTHDYVSRLCRDGKVPGKKIGRVWFIEAEPFQEFLSQQEDNKDETCQKLSKERKRDYQNIVEEKEIEEVTRLGLPEITFPKHFAQEIFAITISVALVFGTYLTKDSPFVHSAFNTSNSYVTAQVASVHKNINNFKNGVRDGVKTSSQKMIASAFEITSEESRDNLKSSLKEIFTYENISHGTANTIIGIDKVINQGLSSYLSVINGTGDAVVTSVYRAVDLRKQFTIQVDQSISDVKEVATKENALQLISSAKDSVTFTFYDVKTKSSTLYKETVSDTQSAISTGISNTRSALAGAPERISAISVSSIPDFFGRMVENTRVRIALWLSFGRNEVVVAPEDEFEKERTIINQPVIERIIETKEIIVQSGITETDVQTKLEQLNNKLSSEIYRLASANTSRIVNNYNVISQTNNIDKLGRVAISNSTFTDGTISGSTSFSGTTGAFSGALSAASFTVGGNTSIGGDLTIDTSGLVYNSSTGNVGIGTSTPYAKLSVVGPVVGEYFHATSTTATSTFDGGVILTRVPSIPHTFSSWATGASDSALFDASLVVNPASVTADSNLISAAVGGSIMFLVDAEGDVFTNSLTAVGGVTLSTTTASTFAVEGNTTLGDSITDVTTINGTLTVTGATSVSTVSGNFGVGTTSPWARLSVSGTSGDTTTPLFTISTSTASATSTAIYVDANGRFGVGTTSPSAVFAVEGNAYINGVITTDLTTSGTVDFNGNGTTTFTGDIQTGGLAAINYIETPFILATSTTATSTFAGGFAAGSSGTGLVYDYSTGNVGIGTASPTQTLSVSGNTDITGALTLGTALTVANGGTGWANLQAGGLLYGNGTGAVATTTQGTAGQILSWLSGIPTWTATTTFSGGLTYLTGNVTADLGTAIEKGEIANSGTLSFDWVNSEVADDLTIDSSNAITAPNFVADSATATSTFAGGLAVETSGLVYDYSTNRVGIGTAGPSNTLTVSGNADFTGNVGIGTTSPWGKLSVEMDTETPSFVVSNTGSTSPALYISGINGDGNVGIGTIGGTGRRLDVFDAGNPQLRLSQTSAIYTNFQVAASTGDLTIDLNPNTTANDIFMTQTGGTTGVNLRVCEGSACPSVTINNGGNVLVENAVYFGNGFRIDQVVGTTTEIAVYGVTATTTPIIIFDEF